MRKNLCSQLVFVVLLNQAVSIPLAYSSYDTWKFFGGPDDMRTVPETKEVFLGVFMAMLGHDFFFYHSHRSDLKKHEI